MYGTRHTKDYGESVPDVWRQAIAQLKPFEIQRGIRRLTSGGSGSPPTLPQFMKACRTIGEDEGPSNPGRAQLPPPSFDSFHAHGQKCMLHFLNTNSVSNDMLPAMIESKNRIIAQYRSIATADEVSGSEIRDALFKAWRTDTMAKAA